MNRRTPAIVLTLALGLGLSLPAGAVNPKNVVECLSVALGANAGVASEYVAVPDKYTARPDRYALYLTLEEHRFTGQVVFLGEQTVLLSDTTLVTENGPDGRDVVDVAWVTAGVEANSMVRACAQVIDTRTGGTRDGIQCNLLTPVIP